MAIVGLATRTRKLCRRARNALLSPLAAVSDGDRSPGSKAQASYLDDEPMIAASIVCIGESEACCSLRKPSCSSRQPLFCVAQPDQRGGEALCSKRVTTKRPGKAPSCARQQKKLARQPLCSTNRAASFARHDF
jgi:hypothetical protein